MGLDQYAYVSSKSGQRSAFYETGEFVNGDFVNPNISNPRDIAYWRKHLNLHGWMERLWLRKQFISVDEIDQFIQGKFPPRKFNGVELELTWDDIMLLEHDIKSGKMAALNITGFFGKPRDDYYREQDLEFCASAKSELFIGLRVFYNASW